MRPAVALLAVPFGGAIVANAISLGLLEARLMPGLDGTQILIVVLIAAVLLVWLGIARRHAASGASPLQSAFLGIAAALVMFVLAWVPVLILLALYPPS